MPGMRRWVGLGVIADNVVNIGRAGKNSQVRFRLRSSYLTPCRRIWGDHPNIRTLARLPAPALQCSDVRLGGQETRKRVLELRCPVTVPREICSLGRMNDDRTDLEVFQQCRDLVFGDWTAAAIFVPLRVWIGEKLLQHLLRCYLRAVVGKHRPQCCKQLNSYAGLIWSTREVNRRPTRLLGPTTTSVLRNLQWRFPIGTQPIVKTWRQIEDASNLNQQRK